MNLREALIVANGEQLNADKLKSLAEDKTILVLDGAYEFVHQLLPVDYLLGDFDSIDPTFLNEAKEKGVEIIDAPDQNFTDLEKGLRFLDKLKFNVIHICAATGLRLDHTLHNLRALSRYYDIERKIYLHTNTEIVFAMKDETLIYEGRKGDGFALLGAPECVVTTEGLQYEMKDYPLSYSKNSSVCNRMNQDAVTLFVKGSAVVIHTF